MTDVVHLFLLHMQIVGAVGSIAFAALLGVAPLTLAVPVANGASLLTAAAGDWLLGDRMDLRFLPLTRRRTCARASERNNTDSRSMP
jgi:hypothetical protein